MPKLKCFEIIIIFDVLSLFLPIPDGKKKKKEHVSFMAIFYAVLSPISMLVTYVKKKSTYHNFTTNFIESLDSIRCSAT